MGKNKTAETLVLGMFRLLFVAGSRPEKGCFFLITNLIINYLHLLKLLVLARFGRGTVAG